MRRLIFILCLAAVSVCGCLKETPKSSTTAQKYYRSVAQIKTGLNGCYLPLRSIVATRGFWFMTELNTDLLFISGSTMYDANCDVSPAKPSVATTIWQNGYKGVMYANEMIADINYAVEQGFVKENEVKEYIAEAVVLRAMYYYLLTSTFGDVPFYTEKVTEQNRASIACLPRMSAQKTREYCIEDIRTWVLEERCLPFVRTYTEGHGGRIGAAVGLMTAAKMAMWNSQWEDALTFVEALEGIYGASYSSTPEQFGVDYPLTDVPFSVKFAKESILELENKAEDYGVKVTSVIAAYATPTRKSSTGGSGEEGTSFYIENYDGILIPALGPYARITSTARPTAYLYKQLLPYYSTDLRNGEYSNNSSVARGSSGAVAWRWKGYDAANDSERNNEKVMWFASSNGATTRPWLGNKFWCGGMRDQMDANNYKIFRFADALLMKAEAYLNLENPDKACAYLNITRTRAGLEPLTFAGVGSSKVSLMEEIRKERAKELVGEFQRKFDLVRWGIWYDRTKMYNESTHLQDNIRHYHRYWPIPADQVSYSGGALDNNEYKE